ncbi:hypothetical protein ACNKHL_00110 [Shigella flexneri]
MDEYHDFLQMLVQLLLFTRKSTKTCCYGMMPMAGIFSLVGLELERELMQGLLAS